MRVTSCCQRRGKERSTRKLGDPGVRKGGFLQLGPGVRKGGAPQPGPGVGKEGALRLGPGSGRPSNNLSNEEVSGVVKPGHPSVP